MNVQQMTSSCMEAYFRRAKEQASEGAGVRKERRSGKKNKRTTEETSRPAAMKPLFTGHQLLLSSQNIS